MDHLVDVPDEANAVDEDGGGDHIASAHHLTNGTHATRFTALIVSTDNPTESGGGQADRARPACLID